MNLSNKLRKLAFFQIDKIKGSKISNHLKDLDNFSNLSEVSFFIEQNLRLEKILNYASKNCDFYKNFDDLSSFPIINKQIIKNNESEFLSKEFELENLKSLVTSGSTGTPFRVYHDTNKILRNTADTIYFAKKTSFNLGDPLYYLKIWNKFNIKSPLQQKAQNVFPINVFDLSPQNIKKYIEQWNKSKTSISILGYVSAILEISKYISKNEHLKRFKVHSTITMSEGLDDSSRKLISNALNCDVYARYSTVENGIIAQQYNSSNHFLINSSSYKVEIFKIEEDNIEKEGNIGRIVITDFFNFGMPLIRYDTGDLGSMRRIVSHNKVVEIIEKIEGRRMDAIYDTNGNLLSSYVITNGMWDFSEINQYQFIQKSKTSYSFKLSINENFEREGELIDEFRKYLGNEAIIDIEYDNNIPLLSSGKRKKVVNLMTQI
jgi:phenylacetate-CoA ligase